MKLRWIQFTRHSQRLTLGILVMCSALLLSTSREPTTLETVLARGELRMATRVGPITYYEDGRGPNGFEYLLASQFAESLGVALKVSTTDTLAKLYNMLGGPNADFAAASLTITPQRLVFCRFTDSYGDVNQIVVYRRGQKKPRTVEDLIGKHLVVIKHSSHEEQLLELKAKHPDLEWTAIDNVEMVELIEMVAQKDADLAIVDSTSYNAHRAMYPLAAKGFELTEPQQLGWSFPLNGDSTLIEAANRFFAESKANGFLDNLHQKSFSGLQNFSIGGSQNFRMLMKQRLPHYEPMFREVGDRFQIDWHLLAAIAYQESHWNPGAVSPTGVKGMMMLTLAAASEVGVDDRTDPEQSLTGGTQYLLNVKARLPEDIQEPDRTWFALAGYNVGLGHLEDARVLTERAGKNPDLWEDVREHLPLLQREKYYNTVRHGYARGTEPVIYVQNIRKYHRLLRWSTVEKQRRSQRESSPDAPPPPEWKPNSFLTL